MPTDHHREPIASWRPARHVRGLPHPHLLDERAMRRLPAHRRVATILQPGDRVGYLGDYDLSGGHIEANTRKVLEEAIGGELDWERLALTREQVDQYALPSITKRDRPLQG